jgi:hypothetical protein
MAETQKYISVKDVLAEQAEPRFNLAKADAANEDSYNNNPAFKAERDAAKQKIAALKSR